MISKYTNNNDGAYDLNVTHGRDSQCNVCKRIYVTGTGHTRVGSRTSMCLQVHHAYKPPHTHYCRVCYNTLNSHYNCIGMYR